MISPASLQAIRTAAELEHQLQQTSLIDKVNFCENEALGQFYPARMDAASCDQADQKCNEAIRAYWQGQAGGRG